jgi:CRP-like cAMP-binding protein
MTQQTMDKLNALRQTALFNGLNDLDLSALADASCVEHYRLGATIFRENDPGGTMYIVVTGNLELIVRDKGGNEVTLLTVAPGQVFGEMSLLDNRPRSASARTLTDVSLLSVSRETLVRITHQHPTVALHLLELLAGRLRYTASLVQERVVPNATDVIEVKRTLSDRISDFFTDGSGNIGFVIFSLLWFTVWIIWNLDVVPGLQVFDPFPFGLLTMVVSLEMVFLSLFILIKQKRQAANDRVRDDIEYEVNVRAEAGIRNLSNQLEAFERRITTRLDVLERSQAAHESQATD